MKNQISSANEAFVRDLVSRRLGYELPHELNRWATTLIDRMLAWLFPHFAPSGANSLVDLESEQAEIEKCLCEVLVAIGTPNPEEVCESFFAGLPEVYESLIEDARAIFEHDPAAESVDQVILAYPGFYAIAVHRLAHLLYSLHVPLFPRLLSETAHVRTGVDIHPGARIGREFVIDHGTGIVIGETSVIGDQVKIYQGVTLGAYSVHKRLTGTKRHPTIEDGVVIYAHATILGGSTVIGKGTTIGGNSWVTQSVPPFSVVSHRSTIQSKQTTVEQLPDFAI